MDEYFIYASANAYVCDTCDRHTYKSVVFYRDEKEGNRLKVAFVKKKLDMMIQL